MRSRWLALAALVASAGCENRTYLVITVDADPALAAISELRFESRLMRDDSVLSTDEQTFAPGGAIAFPRSFLVVADGRGKVGEEIDVFVEGMGSGSAVIARGRGQARVVSGGESTTQITLTGPCVEVDDCLGGESFCTNPHTCQCEGDDCNQGFCEPIVLDDGNPCTTTSCDEETRVVTQDVVENGRTCTTGEGVDAVCASGVCKLPACGDFIVDMNEECDEGLLNSDVTPLACRTDCRVPHCGDRVLDQGIAFGRIYDEECDELAGNSNTAPDGCREIESDGGSVLCRLAFCGDGVLDTGERCDDRNVGNGDGCNPTCSLLGEVTLLAGGPGGAGSANGIGEAARVRDVFAMATIGSDVYFTADEVHAFANEEHSVRRISLPSNVLATAAGSGVRGYADGTGAQVRFQEPRGVASDGTLLYIADLNNNRIRRLDPSSGEVVTIAGTGNALHGDGPLATATFANPRFVAARSTTEILVMDTNISIGCRLRRIDLAAGQVSTLAGDSTCDFPLDGTGTDATFGGDLSGIVIGPDGMPYVADTGTVRRINMAVNPVAVTTIADAASGLNEPLGGLVAGDDELFVADRAAGVVWRVALPGGEVTQVDIGDTLLEPRALGLVGQTLLIAEAAEHTLRAVDLAGTPPLTAPVIAGKVAQPGGTNGDGLSARFDAPSSVALLTSGAVDRLFVAEETVGRIRTIRLDLPAATVATLPSTPSGAILSLVGTNVLIGVFEPAAADVLRQLNPATGAPTGLPGQPIDLDSPIAGGVAVIGNDAYVAAITSSVIQRVNLATGARELFAGVQGVRGVADGSRQFALFASPEGIVACGGDLYVTEGERAFVANVIRKIDMTTGTVSTIAGSVNVEDSRDGLGAQALFDAPDGIACDGENLYVAEKDGHVVRQIELATGRVTTLAGVPYEAGAIDGTGGGARFNSPRGLIYDPASGDLFVIDRLENVVRRIH